MFGVRELDFFCGRNTGGVGGGGGQLTVGILSVSCGLETNNVLVVRSKCSSMSVRSFSACTFG